MINLPNWKLTLVPPLYDTASHSPIEMTAQVYAKMRELIEAFNELDSKLGDDFKDFTTKVANDVEEFEKTITCLLQNYIQSVDTKLFEQDAKINHIIDKELDSMFTYNPDTEEIIIGDGLL